MDKYRYLCSLTFVDNFGKEIRLSSFDNVRVKYFYFNDNVWTSDIDYNIDEFLNVLWVRLPLENYSNKFLVNIAVGVEQVYTSGVQDVEWTKLPNPNAYTMTLVPVLSDNAEGFAPRVIDGYWYEYSQLYGGLYNTGIKAGSTTISGETEVVDFAEKNNTKPITSNAVYNIKTDLGDKIFSNTRLITQNQYRLDRVSEEINRLNNKNYSVKLNDKTVAADETGLIDLGNIGEENLTLDNNIMTENFLEVNNTIIPPGSTYFDYGDGTYKITSLSSFNSFLDVKLNQDKWIRVAKINSEAKTRVKYSVHNSTYSGDIFIEKNGYNFSAKTTSVYLSSAFKIYQVGLEAWLICKGNSHVNCSVFIEYDGGLYSSGIAIENYDENKAKDIPYFLTSLEEKQDFINIDTPIYETTSSDIVITNYNVSCSTKFKFTDDLDYPITLRFNIIADDIKIVVEDTKNEETGEYYFSTESENLKSGDIATLFFTSNQEGGYFWGYSRNPEFEVVENKTQVINEDSTSTQYPSAKAVYDALSNIGPTTDLNIKNGEGTRSIQQLSYAEPARTQAVGKGSAAFNNSLAARGQYSTTFGDTSWTDESASNSIAGGDWTAALAHSSIAMGTNIQSYGDSSAAFGWGTATYGTGELACGMYNNPVRADQTDNYTMFSVGIGTGVDIEGDTDRKNAFEVRKEGDIYLWKDNNYIKLQDYLGAGGSTVSYDESTNTLTIDGESYELPKGSTVSYDESSKTLTIDGNSYTLGGGSTVSYNESTNVLTIDGSDYELPKGTVNSVNGISPDSTGDIKLYPRVLTINNSNYESYGSLSSGVFTLNTNYVLDSVEVVYIVATRFTTVVFASYCAYKKTISVINGLTSGNLKIMDSDETDNLRNHITISPKESALITNISGSKWSLDNKDIYCKSIISNGITYNQDYNNIINLGNTPKYNWRIKAAKTGYISIVLGATSDFYLKGREYYCDFRGGRLESVRGRINIGYDTTNQRWIFYTGTNEWAAKNGLEFYNSFNIKKLSSGTYDMYNSDLERRVDILEEDIIPVSDIASIKSNIYWIYFGYGTEGTTNVGQWQDGYIYQAPENEGYVSASMFAGTGGVLGTLKSSIILPDLTADASEIKGNYNKIYRVVVNQPARHDGFDDFDTEVSVKDYAGNVLEVIRMERFDGPINTRRSVQKQYEWSNYYNSWNLRKLE